MIALLWATVVILVALWLVGWLVVHIGGGLIHLLLAVVVIVLIYSFFAQGRRGI
jgi:hypothetical protein